MARRTERTRWVSYLRVSTVEQAEKDLSLTAQRRSAEEFAARQGAVIDHHYVEPGASGTDTHRTVFNELLGDALRPGSAIAVIVVHHTSRFTRDATHARVVKKELRRAGVRVISVTQELAEDPMFGLSGVGARSATPRTSSRRDGTDSRARADRSWSRVPPSRAFGTRSADASCPGTRWTDAAKEA